MKQKRRFAVLVSINLILVIAIVVGGFYMLTRKISEQGIQKDLQQTAIIEKKVFDFLEERREKYRPESLENYTGPTAVGVPILMYHDVVATKPEKYDGNKLFVDDFREHVKYLAENGYRTLTIDEFDKFYRKEIEIPEKSVLMTFDDGFRSVKELIEPILKEYNMHAVSFIIGEKTVNEPEWFITPDEIKDLQTRNFVEFQSHSYGLHKAGSNGRGRIETIDGSTMLEDMTQENQLIGATNMFCYPFGHAEENAVTMLQEGKIAYGVTIAFGYATRDTDQYKLPRVRINANTSVEDFARIIEY